MKSKLGSNVKPLLMVLVLSSIVLIGYQNCSNSASFSASSDLTSLSTANGPVTPQYATKTAGDADSFPPLKLLFVVDNSGTMEINQINLASAFDRMFVGTNATNLAPFDTTAYVISTSQYSPDKTQSVFPLLPSQSAEAFASMSTADFMANRGATLSGKIPGDLVGFGLSVNATADRTVTSFYPAPVALYRPGAGGSTVVSRYSHKSQNGSVDDFSSDFKERLAILNPTKSAIDPQSRRGVLDDVIDKESGLCGVARVLKGSQGYLNPGDLTSIIIVSDENDSDASGRSCYDSIIEAKSGVSYVDGHCDAAQTNLQFRAAVVDPSKAKCQVTYQNGFGYRVDYKLPTVDVKYYTSQMKYDQLRTKVSYFTQYQTYNQLRTDVKYYTSQMKYDKIQTIVSYYTKAPTYKVPQTNVTYFTKSCSYRDGAETNCQYSPKTTTLSGDFKNQCATFVAGRLPGDAVTGNASYLPTCAAGTPVAATGACSSTDSSILDCQQNYSGPLTKTLDAQPTAATPTACAAFYAGKLPAGALTNGATDAGYTPSCGTPFTTANQSGSCTVNDLDKTNCRTEYTLVTAPVTLDGTPGTKTCSDFARGLLGANAVYDEAAHLPTCTAAAAVAKTGACSTTNANITDCVTKFNAQSSKTLNGRIPSGSTCEATFKSQLPSDTALGNSTYPITCQDDTTLADQVGACSTTNTNIANCRTVYSASMATTNLQGVVSSTCAAFVSGRLPAGAVYTDAGYTPTCAVGTSIDSNKTGNEAYSKWPSVTAVVGDACTSDVLQSVVASNGLLVATGTTPTCKYTSVNTSSQILADSAKDLPCAIANWKNVCDSSNSGYRNCAPTEIAAGDKYEATPKTQTYEGTFTCNTLCSMTGFCKDKTGTVGDNYYACSTTPSNTALVKSTFTMDPDTATCAAGLTRVVTNGPYKTTSTKPAYVAGTRSDANSATALVDTIVERSRELFKDALPIVSVFVRQAGDSLGTNGSLGTEYNRLADMMGGKKLSVLSTADQYATALQDLSGKIRERLGQSVSFREVQPNQSIRKVWLRTKGAADFTQVDSSMWSASGGTITLSKSLAFNYGDEFKIEYW